jgi:hypothetical protein
MNDIANELVSDPSLNQLCERLGLAQVCAVTLSVAPPPFLIIGARARSGACVRVRACVPFVCARVLATARRHVIL